MIAVKLLTGNLESVIQAKLVVAKRGDESVDIVSDFKNEVAFLIDALSDQGCDA